MRYASLLRNAWMLTRKSKRLVWFAMVPAFFQVIITLAQVSWQAYRYGNMWNIIEEDGYLSGLLWVGKWIAERDLVGYTVLFLFITILFVYLIPPLFNGVVLLGVKHRLQKGFGYMSLRQKILESSKLFFQLFELNAVKRFFALWGTLLWGASFYRWTLEGDLPINWAWIRPFWIFLILISILGTIFLAFSYFYMAYDKKGLKDSIWKSVGLSFVRLGTVFAVGLLMLLIQLRVVFNIVLVLGLPAILAVFGAWWLSPVTTFFVWLLVLLMLVVVSYLNALIDVFSDAVWAQVYFRLRDAQEEEEADE